MHKSAPLAAAVAHRQREVDQPVKRQLPATLIKQILESLPGFDHQQGVFTTVDAIEYWLFENDYIITTRNDTHG